MNPNNTSQVNETFPTLRLLVQDGSAIENILLLTWIFIFYIIYICVRQEAENAALEENAGIESNATSRGDVSNTQGGVNQ